MAEIKIKVAIVGASGYSGEELVRLLLGHPHVNLSVLTSRQYAGQPMTSVFPRFAAYAGASDLVFSAPSIDAGASSCPHTVHPWSSAITLAGEEEEEEEEAELEAAAAAAAAEAAAAAAAAAEAANNITTPHGMESP